MQGLKREGCKTASSSLSFLAVFFSNCLTLDSKWLEKRTDLWFWLKKIKCLKKRKKIFSLVYIFYCSIKSWGLDKWIYVKQHTKRPLFCCLFVSFQFNWKSLLLGPILLRISVWNQLWLRLNKKWISVSHRNLCNVAMSTTECSTSHRQLAIAKVHVAVTLIQSVHSTPQTYSICVFAVVLQSYMSQSCCKVSDTWNGSNANYCSVVVFMFFATHTCRRCLCPFDPGLQYVRGWEMQRQKDKETVSH